MTDPSAAVRSSGAVSTSTPPTPIPRLYRIRRSFVVLAGENGPVLGPLTTTDVGDRPVLVIPLGATEQHGPHLPLDTDARIATAWAELVQERLAPTVSAPILVAPTLNYGSSGEHAGFPGTMSIGSDVAALVMVELARSVREWAGPLIFLSGHAGNHRAMQQALETMRFEGDRAIAVVPVLANSDAHAGRTETSLMLHIAPDLVQLERAAPGRTEPIRELIDELRASGVQVVSPSGVLGDPAGASASEGAELLDRLVHHALGQISATSILD